MRHKNSAARARSTDQFQHKSRLTKQVGPQSTSQDNGSISKMETSSKEKHSTDVLVLSNGKAVTRNHLQISNTSISCAKRSIKESVVGESLSSSNVSPNYINEMSEIQLCSNVQELCIPVSDHLTPLSDLPVCEDQQVQKNRRGNSKSTVPSLQFNSSGRNNSPFTICVKRNTFVQSRVKAFNNKADDLNILPNGFCKKLNGRESLTLEGNTEISNLKSLLSLSNCEQADSNCPHNIIMESLTSNSIHPEGVNKNVHDLHTETYSSQLINIISGSDMNMSFRTPVNLYTVNVFERKPRKNIRTYSRHLLSLTSYDKDLSTPCSTGMITLRKINLLKIMDDKQSGLMIAPHVSLEADVVLFKSVSCATHPHEIQLPHNKNTVHASLDFQESTCSKKNHSHPPVSFYLPSIYPISHIQVLGNNSLKSSEKLMNEKKVTIETTDKPDIVPCVLENVIRMSTPCARNEIGPNWSSPCEHICPLSMDNSSLSSVQITFPTESPHMDCGIDITIERDTTKVNQTLESDNAKNFTCIVEANKLKIPRAKKSRDHKSKCAAVALATKSSDGNVSFEHKHPGNSKYKKSFGNGHKSEVNVCAQSLVKHSLKKECQEEKVNTIRLNQCHTGTNYIEQQGTCSLRPRNKSSKKVTEVKKFIRKDEYTVIPKPDSNQKDILDVATVNVESIMSNNKTISSKQSKKSELKNSDIADVSSQMLTSLNNKLHDSKVGVCKRESRSVKSKIGDVDKKSGVSRSCTTKTVAAGMKRRDQMVKLFPPEQKTAIHATYLVSNNCAKADTGESMKNVNCFKNFIQETLKSGKQKDEEIQSGEKNTKYNLRGRTQKATTSKLREAKVSDDKATKEIVDFTSSEDGHMKKGKWKLMSPTASTLVKAEKIMRVSDGSKTKDLQESHHSFLRRKKYSKCSNVCESKTLELMSQTPQLSVSDIRGHRNRKCSQESSVRVGRNKRDIQDPDDSTALSFVMTRSCKEKSAKNVSFQMNKNRSHKETILMKKRTKPQNSVVESCSNEFSVTKVRKRRQCQDNLQAEKNIDEGTDKTTDLNVNLVSSNSVETKIKRRMPKETKLKPTEMQKKSEKKKAYIGDIPLASEAPGELKKGQGQDRKHLSQKFVGAHCCISGGVSNAVAEAASLGARAFGLFVRNGRSWKLNRLDVEEAEKFKASCKEHDFPPHLILPHGSYLLNCGSSNPDTLQKSRDTLIHELQICEMLGLTLYNFHPGSACGKGSVQECISTIAESINLAHQQTRFVKTVIENMSCQGQTVGGKFEELKAIINNVKDKSRIGVCLDTCHAFAAGFDLSNESGFKSFMEDFDRIVGLQYLTAMHLNDSKGKLGCHLDRHENIGKGHIGIEGFRLIMNDPRLNNIPLILETPVNNYAQEIETLCKLEIIEKPHL